MPRAPLTGHGHDRRTAIKCINAEQAEALLYFEGEPDHRH
jgi:hypothetical protein